jgi:hypothetical protein
MIFLVLQATHFFCGHSVQYVDCFSSEKYYYRLGYDLNVVAEKSSWAWALVNRGRKSNLENKKIGPKCFR